MLSYNAKYSLRCVPLEKDDTANKIINHFGQIEKFKSAVSSNQIDFDAIQGRIVILKINCLLRGLLNFMLKVRISEISPPLIVNEDTCLVNSTREDQFNLKILIKEIFNSSS